MLCLNTPAVPLRSWPAARARGLFSRGTVSRFCALAHSPALSSFDFLPAPTFRPVFYPVRRFCMNATDLVLILLLVACAVLAFRRIVRRKGTGCCSGSAGTGGCSGSCTCGSSSSGCAGSCSAGLTAPLVRQSGDADASDASETSATTGTTDSAGTSGSSGTADASGSSASSGVSASSGGSDSF